MPRFVDIEQGSPEWLEMRKECITATDVACIMGVNPYETAYERWKLKMGLIDPKEENDAMRNGRIMEPEILLRYSGDDFRPAVVLSDENDRFMASLDGWRDGPSKTFNNLLEIKCGKSAYSNAKNGIIPIYYKYQMQWQMYITRQDQCIYIASNGTEDIYLSEQRDQSLIDEMIFAALGFLNFIDTCTPPPLSDRDYVDRSGDDQLESLMQNYVYLSLQIKNLEKQLERSKSRVVSYCEEKNTICDKGKVTRIVTKGRVKYDSIPYIQDVNLDEYRGPDTISYRISFNE
jgi:putative phage-type endonuclease